MATRQLSVLITGNTANFSQAVGSAIASLSSLGNAAVQFGSAFSGAIASSLSSATSSISRFASQSNATLTSFYQQQDAQRRAFDAGWGRLGDSLKSVGQSLTIGLTAPLVLLSTQAFRTYAQIDALKLGLENIEGSAQKASARFNELRQVAALPGLGLEEAVQGDVRLRAVGFSATLSKQALLQFGNALALTGGGKFELGNVITQLTQMGSKAKVLSEDLKPILTSSPVVAKAIKDMFGTVDSEGISAKLGAAGRGPQEFIADLVAKLSQLERVKGGPKNALENLGDALKIAEYNFGAAADRAFGLTAILNNLGNYATGVADKFSALPAGIQKTIFVVGAAIAIIGPLALAISGLIALVPAVVAGFGLITATLGVALGPIAAIGAGVVAASLLIATHWDAIKAVLTNSGIWDSLSGLVQSAWQTVKSVFALGAGTLKIIWDRFGGWLIAGAKTAFDTVASVFRLGAGVLTGIFRLISGVLTLDWRLALNGIVTIAKSVWNAVIDVFKLGAGVIGRIIAEALRTFGAEALADKVSAGLDKALGKVNRLKGVINQSPLSTAPRAATKVGSVNVAAGLLPKPYDYSAIDLGGSALKKAKDRLKELKDLIGSGKLKGQDVTALQAEFDTLSQRIDKATASTKKHTAAHEAARSALSTNERILKRLTQDFEENGDHIIKNSDGTTTTLSRQIVALRNLGIARKQALTGPLDLGNKLQEISRGSIDRVHSALMSVVAPLTQLPGLADRSTEPAAWGTLSFYNSQLEKIRDNVAKISLKNLAPDKDTLFKIQEAGYEIAQAEIASRGVDFTAAVGRGGAEADDIISANKNGQGANKLGQLFGGDNWASTALANLGRNRERIIGNLKDMTAAVQTVLQQGASQAAEAMGTFVGGLLAGTTNISDLPKIILGTVADMLQSLAQALAASAAVMLFIPGLQGQAVAQFAGATGLFAVSALARTLAQPKQAKAFANGGYVTSPTLSLTGEYGGASLPGRGEFIAPANKGAGIIAENLAKMGLFGEGGGNLSVKVSGADLYLVLERYKRNNP